MDEIELEKLATAYAGQEDVSIGIGMIQFICKNFFQRWNVTNRNGIKKKNWEVGLQNLFWIFYKKEKVNGKI